MAGCAGDIRGRCSLHRNPKFAEEKLRSPRARSPGKRAGSRAPSPSPSLPPQIPVSYWKLWPNMAGSRSGELVRDMSNVPCFLQRAEKMESVQERALNFGVLDWRRLERWNDDKSRPPLSSDYSSTLSAVGSSTCSDLPSQVSWSRRSNFDEEFANWKVSSSLEDEPPMQILKHRKNVEISRSGDFSGSSRFGNYSSGDFPSSSPIIRDEVKRFLSVPDLSRSSSGRRSRESNSSDRSKRSRSPLRKILDPFLKSSKTSVPASPGRDIPLSISISTSTKQAYLRVSWKDGVPLFTFSITESEILAATKKNEIYTFYSVLESRKKLSGGWMKQGSKKELVSEVVARMTLSPTQSSREFVLLGSDLSSELAAVVQRSNGVMAVILPRGIHGLAVTGRPAPLIERWRTGGKCDCGGWDIGCPLTILRAGKRIQDRTELLSQVIILFLKGNYLFNF